MAIEKKGRTEKKKSRRSTRIDNVQLFILALPAIILLFVFCYIPIGGVILAFKKFKVNLGILGSPWSGLDNFRFFFTSSDAWRVIRNTLGMNFLFIVFTTLCSVVV